MLQHHGFDAVQMQGGFSEWEKSGKKVVQK
jgi:rhodanese-related sulfurtransferase